METGQCSSGYLCATDKHNQGSEIGDAGVYRSVDPERTETSPLRNWIQPRVVDGSQPDPSVRADVDFNLRCSDAPVHPFGRLLRESQRQNDLAYNLGQERRTAVLASWLEETINPPRHISSISPPHCRVREPED